MPETQSVLCTQDDLLLCNACGTQYPTTASKDECRVCDDPRQFVPPEGQSFTTLSKLRSDGYKNLWWQDDQNRKVWFVRTEPQFAIGQRAILLQTSHGNVLWDLISLLDEETVQRINDLGGLAAIVISHPHYYTTYRDWARTFRCPVYIAEQDKEWLNFPSAPDVDLKYLTEIYTEVLAGSGVQAVIVGGHFPGSLLLHWNDHLFIADTIVMSPSALNPVPGKPGVISFAFFWSIPNRIPLPPEDVLAIWRKVKPLSFHTAYGAFKGMDIHTMANEEERNTGGVKGRLLESCKIYVKAIGWSGHAMNTEEIR